VHRETGAYEGRATPWIDRANAGKGVIRPNRTHDARGTHSYRCGCGRDIPIRADRRLRLYLEAFLKGQHEIFI